MARRTLLCHFDSTHCKRGETVTFRIYAKTPQNSEWTIVQGGVQERQVVNGFVLCIDTDPAPNSAYSNVASQFTSAEHGELPGLDSSSWT